MIIRAALLDKIEHTICVLSISAGKLFQINAGRTTPMLLYQIAVEMGTSFFPSIFMNINIRPKKTPLKGRGQFPLG